MGFGFFCAETESRPRGGRRGMAGHRSPPYGIETTAPVGTALCRPRGTHLDARRTEANAQETAGTAGHRSTPYGIETTAPVGTVYCPPAHRLRIFLRFCVYSCPDL